MNNISWVLFSHSGSIIQQQNVSVVEKIGSGRYQIRWDVNFDDDEYLILGSAGTFRFVCVAVREANRAQIRVVDGGTGAEVDGEVSLLAFGP